MCRTKCVLALVAYWVGLAHSWDIAVSVEEQLDFYTNGTITGTVNFISQNLTALVYDEVHNMMLYVDKQRDNDAVYGFNLFSKEKKIIIERNGRNIHSLAFDPVTEILFFTDTIERSINWISLKAGSNNNRYGNLLIKMDDRTPTDIAVDSCRGYIYWVNTKIDKHDEGMERARFDGSSRQVTYIRSLDIFSLAIDPQTQKMYYIDGKKWEQYSLFLNSVGLNSAHFISSDVESIIRNYKNPSVSKELTVSKGDIYWVNSSEIYQTLWKLPKSAKETQEYIINHYYRKTPLSIASNCKLTELIQELQDCETSPLPTITVDPGYISERCVVSACENYCLQGICSVDDEGHPKCRCHTGYSGERCEVNACYGYCLNNGDCSLNEEEEPVCQCIDDHEGSRCEAVKSDTLPTTPTYDMKRNLTLADLLSVWRKPASKMFVIVEI